MSKQDNNYLCLHAGSVRRAHRLPGWNLGYLFISPGVMAYLDTGNFKSDPITTILVHFLDYTKSKLPDAFVLTIFNTSEFLEKRLISHSYVINQEKAVATFCPFNQCSVVRYSTEPGPCDEEIASNKEDWSFIEVPATPES